MQVPQIWPLAELVARLTTPSQQALPPEIERALAKSDFAPALAWATTRNLA